MRIWRPIGLLAAGTVVGQVVQLVAQPFLARLYPPAAFGALGQVLAVATWLTALGTLQMHTLAVLPASPRERIEQLRLGFLATAMTSGVAGVVLLTLGDRLLPGQGAEGALACTATALALSGGALIKGWHSAGGAFSEISVWSLIRAGAVVASQAILGLAGVPGGVLWGTICGEIVGVAWLAVRSRPPGVVRDMLRFSAREAWLILKRVRHYAVAGTSQELVSTIAFMLPTYLFVRQYDMAAGGQYAMAQRLAWAPFALVGSAVAQVAYKRLADLGPSGSSAAVRRGLPRIWGAGACCAAVGFVAAPPLLDLVLGESWADAGRMAAWLAVWGAAFVASVPFRVTYRIRRAQRTQLVVDLVTALAVVGLFAGGMEVQPVSAAAVVALIGVAQNLLLSVLALGRPIAPSEPIAEARG